MAKYKNLPHQKPAGHAFNPNMNLSHADRAAYKHYLEWCRKLRMPAADRVQYLSMNRRDVTHPNNIDVILLA